MHIPPLLHVVDLQTHVNVGSLYTASKPLHPVHTAALVHPEQLLLQAIFFFQIFLIYINYKLI